VQRYTYKISSGKGKYTKQISSLSCIEPPLFAHAIKKGGERMQLMENREGISAQAPLRESTRILSHGGRSGGQQYLDRGFGKYRNTDYEPLHYQDT